MKLWVKIMAGFFVVVLIALFIGSYLLYASQEELKREKINEGRLVSHEIINEIDAELYHRLEMVRQYSAHLERESVLLESNQRFENMTNRTDYIKSKDEEWKSAEEPTQFMEQMLNNDLSENIRHAIQNEDFYKSSYDFSLFPEVFVTNKYGVNVGLSSRTSDYYQADEKWWKKAKEEGLYIGEVRVDPSTGTESVDLAVRIEDDSGEFLGVVNAVMNIQAIRNEIDDMMARMDEYHPEVNHEGDIHLLNKQEEIIYSTGEYGFSDKLPYRVCEKSDGDCEGVKEIEREGRESIIIHSHSRMPHRYPGQGWILVIDYNTNKILKSIHEFRNYFLFLMIAGVLIGLMIDFWIAKTIAGPEEELRKKKEQLEKFAKLSSGREKRMIELKERINELQEELGREPSYDIDKIKREKEGNKKK